MLHNSVSLGQSGLRVSPLCLGTMTFGDEWGWGSSVGESCKVLDCYLDYGGNFLDTANGYTKGHSEVIIGDHLGQHPHKRERIVLATKFQANLYPGDPNAGGAGRKSIISACEESLRRLKTDYIDLYWMHWWDELTPIEETLRTLDDLVRTGKVRYVGFSDTPAWKVAQAQTTALFRDYAPLIGLQIEYSLLERSVEGDLIPMAEEMGLGVTPWSPLKSGVLTGKYNRANAKTIEPARGDWVKANLTEHAFEVLAVVNRIAREHQSSAAAVSLAWLKTRPGVSSIIIGAKNLEQLKANISSLEITLSDAELSELDAATQPNLPFPHAFLNNVQGFSRSGCSIDGRQYELHPLCPKNDEERW